MERTQAGRGVEKTQDEGVGAVGSREKRRITAPAPTTCLVLTHISLSPHSNPRVSPVAHFAGEESERLWAVK